MRPGEQAGGEMIVVGGREDAMVELTLRFHIAMSAVSVAHQRGDAEFNTVRGILQDYRRT